MAKAMTPMRGRQMLHMVYEWYKIDDGAGHMYSMEDLFSVTLKNDDLEAFKDHWDDVVSGFFEGPEPAASAQTCGSRGPSNDATHRRLSDEPG